MKKIIILLVLGLGFLSFISIKIPIANASAPQIDLVIDSLIVMDPTFSDSSKSDFFAHIKSIGGNPDKFFEISWYINGVFYKKQTLNNYDSSWLVGLDWPEARSGTHTIQLVIDSGNVIDELNETNNSRTITFIISEPSGIGSVLSPKVSVKFPVAGTQLIRGQKYQIDWDYEGNILTTDLVDIIISLGNQDSEIKSWVERFSATNDYFEWEVPAN